MGYSGTLRAMQAAERRHQREAQKHLRELEQRAKEQAKLTAIEQARLEVETYENRLEMLLSVHKAQGETWDWMAHASSLPPPCPEKCASHELRAKQNVLVLHPQKRLDSEAMISQAQFQDEQLFQESIRAYEVAKAEWEKLQKLAIRILAGEHKAFIEALVEISPLAEISDLGSLIHFTVENAKIIGCELKVNGSQAIPSEVKTLTATEKVSIKPMPKARFHEIYQDYICGCILRVAREVFAILPVDVLLVTASADILDANSGKTREQAVLSAVMSRKIITELEFDNLDASDALESFTHRSNFKATRKAGAFQPITPLTPSEINDNCNQTMDFVDLSAEVKRMREALRARIMELNPTASKADLETNPTL